MTRAVHRRPTPWLSGLALTLLVWAAPLTAQRAGGAAEALPTIEAKTEGMTNKGVIKQVVLHKSKPQDFEKSEQIVLIGKMQGDNFHANDILMKCPSKYNDANSQVN
jgi:hypothetical protein